MIFKQQPVLMGIGYLALATARWPRLIYGDPAPLIAACHASYLMPHYR